jgi:lipoate---protein ligase
MIDHKLHQWYWVNHLVDSGTRQMALDEALLQWIQEEVTQPVIIARTYCWHVPTLSLGVHQKGASASSAYAFYSLNGEIDLVRRPTGGRAILHGEDISFSFVTNVPELLNASLHDSYCYFTKWVKEALINTGVPLEEACDGSNRDYVRSSLCFETKMPTDLVARTGEKVAGSAQLRRQGGILQHGAAFLKPFKIESVMFDAALQKTVTQALHQEPILLNPSEEQGLQMIWQTLQARYSAEAEQTLTRLATTSGSHLLPASD